MMVMVKGNTSIHTSRNESKRLTKAMFGWPISCPIWPNRPLKTATYQTLFNKIKIRVFKITFKLYTLN